MKNVILMSVLGLLMTACASSGYVPEETVEQARSENPDQVRYFAPVQHQQAVQHDEVIGVQDDQFVVEKKVLMTEELRHLQNEAYSLESEVYGGRRYMENNGAYGTLQICYKKLSEHTGEILPMTEAREYVIPDEEYQLGMDHYYNVIGLSHEKLSERISRFKQYRDVLTQRLTEYQNKVDLCELKMKQAKN